MKKNLVIIGASELQLPLILKAKEKGYETHVFAWRCGEKGEIIADKFYPISIVEKEKILNICNDIKPVGVVSIASDLAVNTVNYVADKLGLIANPIEDTLFTTNKFLMRERLKSKGIKCPKYFKFNSLNFKLDLRYPVIVKPTDRSGSRGVCKVENQLQLEEAIKIARKESFKEEVIIEEYICGKEYSVEFISQNGQHNFLAISEKFTTGAPNFIEIGHVQPVKLNFQLEYNIIKIVKKALDALNIKNGASHSEIIITDDGEIYIIEIGARMGGDCIGSDLVEISTGFDFLSATIDVSVGNEICVKKEKSKNIAIFRHIMDYKDQENLNYIINYHKDEVYRIGNIEEIDGRIIKDSSNRYGFYILKTQKKQLIDRIFNLK